MNGVRSATHQAGMVLAALLISISACALPGAVAPTPFDFPTPHLTLTAIFAPTASDAPPSTALPEAPVTATEAPTGPASSATSAPERVRPNGRPVVAQWVSTPPQIDGGTTEWSSDRYSLTEVTFGIANWSGGDDLSGTYMLAWDEQALYLAVEVMDDLYVQGASGETLFRGDSVEVLLDMELDQDFVSRSLSGDDFQIGFSAGPRLGQPTTEAYRWYPAALNSTLSQVELASSPRADGYVLEIKLPWEAVRGTVRPQSHFGFVLSLSDNDRAGESEQQTLVSSASTRSLTDPTTWGTLILESN